MKSSKSQNKINDYKTKFSSENKMTTKILSFRSF